MYSELIPGSTNCFYSILIHAIPAQFSSQPAYMHIQAAIEGMELPSEHVFREFFACDNFS